MRPLVVPDRNFDRATGVIHGLDWVRVPEPLRSWDVPLAGYDDTSIPWALASVADHPDRSEVDSPDERPRPDLTHLDGTPVRYRHGWPLCPGGRTGRGHNLGGLWRHGPSFAADALVTRKHPEDGWQGLLGCREDNGLWCFPGGFVNPGEPPRRAAVRECAEETGFVLPGCAPREVLWRDWIPDVRQTGTSWAETWAGWWPPPYALTAGQTLAPEPGETRRVGWVTLRDLDMRQISPGHDLLVWLLRERLRREVSIKPLDV